MHKKPSHFSAWFFYFYSMRFWLTLLLLVIWRVTQGAVIVVTSNADSGPGTLRDAIQTANANGIVDRDFIYFNLISTNAAGVTIQLSSELPILSSNIVIDGTSQPTSFLGNPNIKVSLTKISSIYFSGLRLDNAKDVEIYGIEFSSFQSDPLGPIEEKKSGIYLRNSTNIIIGAVNKPNCFNGSYAGILSPFIIPRQDVVNLKISANIFGLSPNGQAVLPNESAIDVSFLKDGLVGGNLLAEGNIIAAHTRNGIALGGADQQISILNNTIGLSVNKNTQYREANANGIYINGDASRPKIVGNYICGQARGIYLDYVNGGYNIENNKIGTNGLGASTFGNDVGIYIKFSAGGVIGGSVANTGNEIAYNKLAVTLELTYPVSILRNSFNCNIKAIDFVNLPNNKTVTTSKISNITATNVNGVYLPNSKIELFYTDACSDCQGKEWIATIATNSTGNWSYNGAIDLSKSVTSMGTNPDGATATFSKPLIDETKVTITNVICNQPTGSIKGIVTYDASIFEWRNASGAIVGNAKDLENVGPGTYKLTARQNNSCSVISQSYTISSNSTGISEANKVITAAYCGQSNGSIKGITTLNGSSKIWYNSAGTEVSRASDLLNVPSGIYYFTTQLGTCNIISPNYTVNNVEFDYKVSREQVNDASCSSSNGSIQVMGFQTVQPDELRWFNASGSEIGRGPSISNLSPGTYTLKGYSNFGCSYTIKSYSITRIPLPVINQAAQKLYVNCDGTKGSIKGISVNGQTAPYTYTWFNANGDEVASGIELNNVPLDKYYLSVTDRFGCEVLSDVADFGTLKITPIKVPNAFTPNGDAVNDVWKIEGVDNYPDATFNVFDRTGNKVFTSKGYNKPFDGTQAGNNLPVGVYFYKIILSANCDPITGSLTIIR